jgi:DTW domain-containing protein YfiP
MSRNRRPSAPRKGAKTRTCPRCGKSVTLCAGSLCATSRGQSQLRNALVAGGTVVGTLVVTNWLAGLLSPRRA